MENVSVFFIKKLNLNNKLNRYLSTSSLLSNSLSIKYSIRYLIISISGENNH
jgi:hypothetical protein